MLLRGFYRFINCKLRRALDVFPAGTAFEVITLAINAPGVAQGSTEDHGVLSLFTTRDEPSVAAYEVHLVVGKKLYRSST